MRLELCTSLESRDGTLSRDAKLKNMVAESVEGELIAVKRPGVTTATGLVSGLPLGVDAQGLAYFNGFVFSMSGDVLYKRGAGGVGDASFSEVIGVTPPSYDFALEPGPDPYGLTDADWRIAPFDPPFYPNYTLKNYTSIAAILAYWDATHPDWAPSSYSSAGPIGSDYTNYPYYRGYILPSWGNDGDNYMQVLAHV